MVINKRFAATAIFFLVSAFGFSQDNRYMVFFKDKSGSPFSVSEPSQYLSQKAIDRRIRHGITVTETDFPVNAGYVQQVEATGAAVFYTTRWMNGVLVQCPASLINSIQALAFVDKVEFVAPNAKLQNNGRKSINQRKKDLPVKTELPQVDMIGVPEMHYDGFRGEGMSIAVFDGGFLGVDAAAPFQEVFTEGRYNTILSHDFVANSGNVFQYDDHGTMVFSLIAANVPDAFTGGAYEANFQLYVTEDGSSEYRVEEYNWLFAAERADSAGVDIIHSSVGYYDFDQSSMNYTLAQMDGKTAVSTKAAQWAAERGVLVVCSAGNEGNIPAWKIITAPADAVDVLAIGNVTAQGNRNGSSSTGPTADGRIKPDLAAMGTGVTVVKPNGSLGTATGTSLSAPLVTGLAAGIWQRYPEKTNKEIMDVLKKTATQAKNPDMYLGYGIPHYKAVVNYLERQQQTNTFEVYPNPTADTVTVRPINPDTITSCRVEIISSQGQLVSEHQVEFSWLNDRYKADLSNVAAGMYYLRIWVGAQRFVFKVMKK
jgi:subtilisin family serine protease